MNLKNRPTITLDTARESLYTAVVCDVLDAMGFRNQSPRIQLVPQTGINKLVGRCRTLLWMDMAHADPHPYDLELKAVDSCKPDDVLIAAGSGSMRSGVWGELLSIAARNRGCVGAIIDGAVRDVPQMRAMGFPVFAKGRSIYDCLHRQRVVDLDVPVEIDSVRINPGDLVVADEDGVVFIPHEVENEILQRAWAKVHAESVTREAIEAGMPAAAAYKKYGVL